MNVCTDWDQNSYFWPKFVSLTQEKNFWKVQRSIIFNHLTSPNFKKSQEKLMQLSWGEMNRNSYFWAKLASFIPFLSKQEFWIWTFKCVSVTFENLWAFNFMQKINQLMVSVKIVSLTLGQMDKQVNRWKDWWTLFTGPFSKTRGPKMEDSFEVIFPSITSTQEQLLIINAISTCGLLLYKAASINENMVYWFNSSFFDTPLPVSHTLAINYRKLTSNHTNRDVLNVLNKKNIIWSAIKYMKLYASGFLFNQMLTGNCFTLPYKST